MINLGLERIAQLLHGSAHTWKAIHVAGTNGKGSVCSYISSMLAAAGNVRHGRFTSPHLVDPWDSIELNGMPMARREFQHTRSKIQRLAPADLGATEFELLTATAFAAFRHHGVQIAAVEVGVGGRRDATNVIAAPLATVITSIGLDHQGLLGDTLEEIALEKAGILKPGAAPCFLDAANPPSVQEVVTKRAAAVGAGPVRLVFPDDSVYDDTLWRVLRRADYEAHQRTNMALAFEAVRYALGLTKDARRYDWDEIIRAIPRTKWPARLEMLDIGPLISGGHGRQRAEVLLDGAHNPQAAAALSRFVESRWRGGENGDGPVTWLLAMTDGKDVRSVLRALVGKGDRVVATAFGPVEGMPWVKAIDAETLARYVGEEVEAEQVRYEPDVENAVRLAADVAADGPMVISGSLYLAGDVIRLLRIAKGERPSS